VRAVVSKRVAGLGSCLVALFRAWDYARRTQRCLVVDWRHSLYSPDPAYNFFNHVFENRAAIADVPIVCGSAVAAFPFAEPFFPCGWTRDNIHEYPADYFPADALDAAYPAIKSGRQEQYEMCTLGRDVPQPTVVFTFPKRLPPSGAGPLHLGTRNPDAAFGALADMMLLSRCDGLLHTTSHFTFYPLFRRRWPWEQRVGLHR
jgi:hypothetical protein